MSGTRRPYDDVKTILAAFLGVPALAGLVYLLLVAVNVVWRDYGLAAGAVAFLVGVAALTYATYRGYALVQAAGGR